MHHTLLLCLFTSLHLSANASSGTGEYHLPWADKKQILLYHSCGCADACWVAELRDRHNHTLRAKLRCDCNSLFFKNGKNKEQSLGAACQEFEQSEDKAALIKQKIEWLLQKKAESGQHQ